MVIIICRKKIRTTFLQLCSTIALNSYCKYDKQTNKQIEASMFLDKIALIPFKQMAVTEIHSTHLVLSHHPL